MPTKSLSETLINEFFKGWKPFELAWLFIFVTAQIWAYVQTPDSTLAMISGIAGLICVVFVSKGKISNYFFGLVFAYTYFYVAWGNNFIGEMNTVLYVYLPAQFIGYFVWKANMQKDKQDEAEYVIVKSLDLKGWVILLVAIAVCSFGFIEAVKAAGGSSATLDGTTTIITCAAQLLMILRYREQWVLWITLNVLSIVLWAETPAMYIMFAGYLINSLYGYYNWTKLQKQLA